MRIFCTYFDSNYIDRGLCLWQSLRKFVPDARLFVCCLDRKTHETLNTLRIDGITAVSVETLEAQYPKLLDIKFLRSKVEYYFTITPSWIRYVFDSAPEAQEVTYLDSDMLFFSSPDPLFEEMRLKDGHVAIIAHRFTPALQHLHIYGTYNVGWITFRNSSNGRSCLLDWQEKCIEWCHDYIDGDRFADQKYLDAWPAAHAGTVVLSHPGANVALWNMESGAIKCRSGQIFAHDAKLIFYHFHGLSQISSRKFFTNARSYGVRLEPIVRRAIYGHYMSLLRKMQEQLHQADIRPLLRIKYTGDDVKFAKRHPFSGVFLYSVLGSAIP